MSTPESYGFWVAVAAYVVSTVTVFGGMALKRPAWLPVALWASAVGLLAQLVSIGARWLESGHLPYVDPYENVLVGTAMMVLGYLLVTLRWRGLAVGGLLILPVVLLTLGYGYTQALPPGPVTAPFRSGWLVVHVTFAWITYAAYSTVAGLAVAYLMRRRAERRGTDGSRILSWVPGNDQIEEISLRLVGFGFLNNAVMIVSGALWAYRLWGAYWSWDPVETWSLLTWLAYGFYLHARLTLRWRGPRLAWLALFALFGVMMAFWGVQLAPTSWHLFNDMGVVPPSASRPM